MVKIGFQILPYSSQHGVTQLLSGQALRYKDMADEMSRNDFSQLLGRFLPGDKFREVTMLLKKVRISILFSILSYAPYRM